MRLWIKLAIAATCLVLSGLVVAKWVGRFYCSTGCTEVQSPAGAFASGETYNFMYSTVNQTVGSWVDSQGNPNTVTICNGTACALYTYVKLSGQWISSGYYYSDWKGSTSGGGNGGYAGGDYGGDDPFSGCFADTEESTGCTRVGDGQYQCVTETYTTLSCPIG